MVQIYVKLIQLLLRVLDEVPMIIREEVKIATVSSYVEMINLERMTLDKVAECVRENVRLALEA